MSKPRGVWGHALPENFWEFRGYEMASQIISTFETTFGPIRCFSEARQPRFTCMNVYLSAHCVVQHWFWFSDIVSQATPFADETRKIHYHSLGRTESCWGGRLGRDSSHCSQTSCKFEHVTCVLGGRLLSNGATW